MSESVNMRPLPAILCLARQPDVSSASWRAVRQEILEAADSLRLAARQVKAPVQMEQIMLQRRIIAVQKFRSQGPVDGVLAPTKDGFQIRIRQDLEGVRGRFSLAHEIGHTFFYDLQGTPPVRLVQNRWGSSAYHKEEDICHAFAASLLMPASLVAEFLARTQQVRALHRIRDMARVFEVSIECAARRVLHDFDDLGNTVIVVADKKSDKLYRWLGRKIRGLRCEEREVERQMLVVARRGRSGYVEAMPQDSNLCVEYLVGNRSIIGAMTRLRGKET